MKKLLGKAWSGVKSAASAAWSLCVVGTAAVATTGVSARIACATLIGAVFASVAGATPPPPPEMDAVVFPVDVASVVAAIGVAGAVILLAWFGIAVGFKLAKKVFRRSTSAV